MTSVVCMPQAVITAVPLVTKCQDALENVTPYGTHKGSLPIAVAYSSQSSLSSGLKTGKQRQEGKVIAIFLGLSRLQTHIIDCNKMMLERN